MRARIFIFTSAFTIVFLLGLFAHLQYFQTRDNIIELYSEKQSTIAYQAAVSLETFIKERIKAVEVLTDLPVLRHIDKSRIMHEFQRTFDIVKGFEYIIYLDTSATARMGYPDAFPCPSKQPEQVKMRFRKIFNKAVQQRKTEVFSKNVLVDGQVYICLISPIFDDNQRFQGAILGILNVKKSLNFALRPIVNGTEEYAWIMNEGGYLIYHPQHEEMLLHNIFNKQDVCESCHLNFELEKNILRNEAGSGIKKNRNSSKQLIGFARVPLENTNWFVVISSPYNSVTSSIRTLFKNNLLMVLLMIGAVISGAMLLYRFHTKHVDAKKEIENLKIQTALIAEKKAAESQYRVLVEQSPDPIFLSTRRQFLMVNHSFETMFGCNRKDVCAPTFSALDLIHPQYINLFKKELKEFVSSRRSLTTMKLNLIGKNKSIVETEISLSRVTLGNRPVYQGIIHDVTKTRLLERERERRKHLAIIGEMAARIAHEIKNPLASIQTGIQLLESQVASNEKQHSYFYRLLQEIQRVDRILKGLLSYARDERLELKPVRMEQLVERVENLIRPTVEKNGQRLSIEIESGLPVVMLDDQKMEQVLWNVFLNSIQASADGARLSFKIGRNSDGVDWTIQDQGKGIPQNIMVKIFQPFFSTRTQGSGLGLAISKKIVEMHHGTMEITSKENQGTTVHIHLPTGDMRE